MLEQSLIDYFIYFQDQRKKLVMMSLKYVQDYYDEIARRFSLPNKLAYQLTPNLIRDLFKGKRPDLTILKQIHKANFTIYHDNNVDEFYYGNEATEKFHQYYDVADYDLNEVKGNCARPGKVKGIVRVILNIKDCAKMKKGEIIVSTMTTPEFTIAMKKAAAIVTDEGGVTCHAAIVSRELGIPCVMGTRLASKVFKDGDLIEVDAEKGIVKRVNP